MRPTAWKKSSRPVQGWGAVQQWEGLQMKLAVIAASLVLIGSVQFQSPKEQYELSERCGKQAAENFKEIWGEPNYFGKGTATAQAIITYENHYSLRLNTCFYLQTRFVTEIKFKELLLYDLHENREIASYRGPFLCCVQKRRGMASFD
jgi:hypothetical protein